MNDKWQFRLFADGRQTDVKKINREQSMQGTVFSVVAFAVIALLYQQEGQPRRLPQPVGVVNDGFTSVVTVTELPDQRVLIADQREQRLIVADLARRTTQPVSKRGSGPGEYERLYTMVSAGGDTTLMIDAPRARGLVLVGSSVAPVPLPPNILASVNQTSAIILGTDRKAILYGGKLPPAPDRTYEIGARDSVALVIVNRSNARLDTIGNLRRAPFKRLVTPGISPGELFRTTVNIAWSGLGETAAMCEDSWIGVVRMEPYRVDWRSPDGRWTRGAPIPYQRIGVNEREKAAYLERNPAVPGMPPIEWPTEIPPQGNVRPMCAPDGRLFVSRSYTVERQYQLFDIVDRRGVLSDRLALSSTQRLVGFGRASMYVATKDSLDLETVGKYAYPVR